MTNGAEVPGKAPRTSGGGSGRTASCANDPAGVCGEPTGG
jgi:hypothetical protein